MGSLSDKLTQIVFGTGAGQPSISRVQLDPTTGGTIGGVPNNAAAATSLLISGDIKATRVWNAVWNDIADYQLLADELVFGKCYMDTKDGALICSQRCQMSVIGIASDTLGFGIGAGANPGREVPIAVAGWVLAYVDKEYECCTVLTNLEDGSLTKMTREEKLEYPERIVGIYKRKEMDANWGPAGRQIQVNDRHWIKVKS